jgi:hypothetical protein
LGNARKWARESKPTRPRHSDYAEEKKKKRREQRGSAGVVGQREVLGLKTFSKFLI